MSTVKLGFIGIGSNASRHMQESQFTENKSPVAFYNIADEKAQKATEIYKSRNYYGNRIRRTLFGYH